MALIEHDLPCRAREIAGQRRAPVVPGWSGGRDEQFTASLDTLVGGLQAVQRGGGAGGAVPCAGCRWRYQSLVSLAHGVMIRTRHEPKSTTRAASTSTPMTRPRPYVSWVT
jgi:hypothetical protein